MNEWMKQGCEICRTGVLSGHWLPPYLVTTNYEAHARLHKCNDCGAWWEENEREAHVISEKEAQATFHEYFAMDKAKP